MANTFKTTEVVYKTLDANEAVALSSYHFTDVAAIYPITPSSPMAENTDEWIAKGKKNLFGIVPRVIEMQSEAGACGALHGALQAGALATTYTASQGLLLMIPDMYKIAGELTSTVIHVAARALAYHALSIFGDHSDVMATRSTGFAMLASSSVQEAHDMATIAHLSTLEARVPFLHFFDGFRTSHEVNKIELVPEEVAKSLLDMNLVKAHRQRALNPEHPFIRGTAQNPDVYFQGREAGNKYYNAVPGIVKKYLAKFAEATGRHYDLIDYFGAKDAESVIVIMGSGASTCKEAVKALNAMGYKVGVLNVHLYRPFPMDDFVAVLPKTVKKIAVLDRTKESGSIGEPLYQDILTTLSEKNLISQMKAVIAGRYGLSSKEFTPAMVKAVFDELAKDNPKQHFTVGINDDVTGLSLEIPEFITESDDVIRAIFYGLGSDGTIGANKNSIKIIGEGTHLYTQGYFVYDSKKSGSRTVSHLRFGPNPIDSPYLITSANFVAVHQFNFVEKTDVLKTAKDGAIFLLNSPYDENTVWEHLPKEVQEKIIAKHLKFYVIDAYKVAEKAGMGNRINTVMQVCFFALANVLPKDEAIAKIKEYIRKSYSKKGEEVVQKNFVAVDSSLANLHEVKVPSTVSANAEAMPEAVSAKAPAFVKDVIARIMRDEGESLKVSEVPADGTFPSGTTKWEKRNVSATVATWMPEACIQCGQCSLVCPHGVIRAKKYDSSYLKDAPASFKSAKCKGKDSDKNFTLQVYVEDCTGCGLCEKACPVKGDLKAMHLAHKAEDLTADRQAIEHFEKIPYCDRESVNSSMPNGAQYLEPLFEFSGACAGCGETPYVKLISQLFGDRMMVANATGCSSIYGGNLPTTPWSCDKNGRGPAWSNSLFEDNAEFGLGYRVAIDQHKIQAEQLLKSFTDELSEALVTEILELAHKDSLTEGELKVMREKVAQAKAKLADKPNAESLLELIDYLVPKSVWMIGGDGWAFDIGFGGLDQALSTKLNVNVLVLDTEVYSNTGGQASKATPIGAIAKFAASGKKVTPKNLALMMMSYGYVYVAQIAIGANPVQAIKAIKEAESYNGPSIIIAYSHCISHGIDMKSGLSQQKLAVDSGYWPLFRFNPALEAEGKNPFILDSKEATIPLKDYLMNENRFRSLQKSNPTLAEELIKISEGEIAKRWAMYKNMADKK